MRIVQIIDTLYVGGAEQMQVYYAKAAMMRNIKPVIVSLADSKHSLISKYARHEGAEIIEFAGNNLFDLRRFVRLLRFLQAEKFDVIHVHLNYAIILGTVAGMLTNTPVVVTLHNSHKSEGWRKLAVLLINIGIKRVIAVGKSVSISYENDLPRKKIRIVPNPVIPIQSIDPTERIALRREIAFDPNRLILLNVGRISVEKGIDDLLQTINILRRTHPQVFLVIVGRNASSGDPATRIKSLNLQNHVRMLGTRSDVPRLLSASDVYVSSSLSEGMPITILEAMAAGLPIVATSVGDIPNLITTDTGLLVPAGDPNAMADKLIYIIDTPGFSAELGRNAKKYVLENHNLETWFDELMKIYKNVLLER